MKNSLRDKTALVTGASRGIGRAVALSLARCGAHVIVHFGTSADEAASVVREIEAGGGRATSTGMDLARSDGPHLLAAQVRTLIGGAKLDVLVANAGTSKAQAIEETTVEQFDRLYAINVRAPYFLLQQLLPDLSAGSSVVMVSSLAAHAAVSRVAAYASTKGAVDTLVRHFGAALGDRGIRVNAVAPGIVATELSNFTKTEEGRRYALNIQALKEIAGPQNIADVVTFLASQESGWITGQTINVDGGSML